MARWGFEFDCPQFVDFVSGLGHNDADDVFANEGQHPNSKPKHIQNSSFISPGIKIKKDEVESQNRLADEVVEQMDNHIKMPKSKIINYQDQVAAQNSPFVNAVHRSVKSANFKRKLYSSQPRPLTRTSSCMTPIAKLPEQVLEKVGFKVPTKTLRKRSSSLGDLRQKKKITYPMTPMCLKRTLQKVNVKKVKSTEEIELEKIAELQKQLSDHLRINEISMRKLKLKVPPSYGLLKSVPQKRCMNLNGTLNKDCKIENNNPFNRKLDLIEEKWRSNCIDVKSNVLRNEAPRAVQIPSTKSKVKVLKESQLCTDKATQNLSHVSCSSKASERGETALPKKPLTIKYGLHSGLLFQQPKKTTVVKPFTFDPKISVPKERKCKEQGTSMKTPQRCGTKENVPINMLLTCSALKRTRDKVVQQWEKRGLK